MADFCKQCSIIMFGQDFGDLKGISTEAETKNGEYAVVICEGCGPTLVDHEGKCVRHEKPKTDEGCLGDPI